MTDSADTANTETFPTDGSQPPAGSAITVVTPESAPGQSGVSDIVAEHPELIVGGAFAGGWLLAMILKRLAD